MSSQPRVNFNFVGQPGSVQPIQTKYISIYYIANKLILFMITDTLLLKHILQLINMKPTELLIKLWLVSLLDKDKLLIKLATSNHKDIKKLKLFIQISNQLNIDKLPNMYNQDNQTHMSKEIKKSFNK